MEIVYILLGLQVLLVLGLMIFLIRKILKYIRKSN